VTARPTGSELLDAILREPPGPFAVLFRPETTGPGVLTVLTGEVSQPARLADIPLSDEAETAPTGADRHEVLTVIPYRQVAERGFRCVDDGAPLIAMTVTAQGTVEVAEALRRIPDPPLELANVGFDLDDESYAETVRRIQRDEIGRGVGANFVLKRSFVADLAGFTPTTALSLFSRLLAQESGAYWTFVVHTGERTFVGASPERHLSVRDGIATMNPISGTLRYPDERGASLEEVLEFLTDPKEIDELHMVLDEELKMMSRICHDTPRVIGPQLREMARLAHTEYFIEGASRLDPRDSLRETLFAPTVTGSPLESACRVIEQYEPDGRGYYSGAIALIGRDGAGQRTLDSAILIRSAEISADGRLRAGVGATLVRHSRPEGEVAETRAKAAGLIAALTANRSPKLSEHPQVRRALAERSTQIASFWRAGRPDHRADPHRELAGRRVLVIDAEDTFTSMIDKELRSLDLDVTVRRYDDPYRTEDYALVVMGPGPGDPTDLGHPKIAHLHRQLRALLDGRRPFLAVCLSHQVLCLQLGLPIVRREVPNQGIQLTVDLFGTPETVGFYNTFAARAEADLLDLPDVGPVRISRDPETGEIHATRGGFFASTQFHAESVLTENGPAIVGQLLRPLARLAGTPARPEQSLAVTG